MCYYIIHIHELFNFLLFGGNLSRLCHIWASWMVEISLDCSAFWSQQGLPFSYHESALMFCCHTYFSGPEGDVIFVFSLCQRFPISRTVLTGTLWLFRNRVFIRWLWYIFRLKGKKVAIIPMCHVQKQGMHPASSDTLLQCWCGSICLNLFRICFSQSWFLKIRNCKGQPLER